MKVVLTIAGSDSSGGAGIQADLKTFEAFGVFGTSVLTVLTAQNTTGVLDIYKIKPSFVQEQLRAIFMDFDVAAIKIGMLHSIEIIKVVKEFIKDLNIPIVLDPVCISKAGSPLLEVDAIDMLKELFEYALVITPNKYEAKVLFGYDFESQSDFDNILNFKTAVLVKNFISDSNKSCDYLFLNKQKKVFQTSYIETSNLHGTGCSFSSAIAANLALGYSLEKSIEKSKEFINLALLNAPSIGNGPGPINHKAGGEKICI
jgi:hydroxymethylpyrimidine/phosphomethylpyrimidine kinase